MEKIVIDLADPQTRSVLMFAFASWATGVLITVYSIVSDVAELARSRKKAKR